MCFKTVFEVRRKVRYHCSTWSDMKVVVCSKGVDGEMMFFGKLIDKFELIIGEVGPHQIFKKQSSNEIKITPPSGGVKVAFIADSTFKHSFGIENVKVKFAAQPLFVCPVAGADVKYSL